MPQRDRDRDPALPALGRAHRRRSSRSRRRSNARRLGRSSPATRAARRRRLRGRPDEPRLLRPLDEGARAARAMLGPGAASAAEFERSHWSPASPPARWLALLIATGIGLHNFSEGLAIGQAAAPTSSASPRARSSASACTTRPRASASSRRCPATPSGRAGASSLLLGVIGGGPTFFGTLIGQAWTSEALSVLFLALAAGLDPLRRHRAAERLPALLDARRSSPGACCSG